MGEGFEGSRTARRSSNAVVDEGSLTSHLEWDYSRIQDSLTSVINSQQKSGERYLTQTKIKSYLLDQGTSTDTAIVLQSLKGHGPTIAGLVDDRDGNKLIHTNDLRALRQSYKDGEKLSLDNRRFIARQGSVTFSFGFWRERALNSSLSLYGPAIPPYISADGVTQAAGVGNCHFAASLTSLAAVNPSAIPKMIQETADGYTVNFPGGNPIKVKRPTIGRLFEYDQLSPYGTWSFILQEGYGSRCKSGAGVEGAGGSAFYHGMRILTNGSVDIDSNWCTTFATMNKKLSDCFKNGRPVAAGITGEFFAPLGLSDNKEDKTGLSCNHAFAVIGYSANNEHPELGEITLKNPTGYLAWDTPPAGFKSLGDGKFQCNLRTFSSTFSELAYATKAP